MNPLHAIYICGSGGTAREVYGILKDLGLHKNIKGFIVGEGYPISQKEMYSIPVICERDMKKNITASQFVVAIGSPERKVWIQKLEKNGARFLTAVHPSSVLLEKSHCGHGVIIYPSVVATTNVSIGSFSIINSGVTIGHDTKIGAFCHVAPGVHIAGNVTIGCESWIGIGSSISMRVSIGSHVMIGAGAVVVSDIPDNVLAVGVPAKVVRTIHSEDWKKFMR